MCFCLVFFFFKQKTAYEMRISDWSSDVCSSDLVDERIGLALQHGGDRRRRELDDVQHELVGTLGLDAVGVENGVREVTEVLGHDDLRVALDRGSEHVTVVRIR